MTPNTKQPKSPDHLWRDILSDKSALAAHANAGIKAVRLARATAARLARNAAAMIQHERTWLMDMIETEYGKRDIDLWLDDVFAPLPHIGEDRGFIMKTAFEGGDLKEWVNGVPALFCKRSKTSDAGKSLVREPVQVPEHLSTDEQNRLLRAQNHELREVLASLKRQVNAQARELAQLHRTIKQVRKRILNSV